MSSPSIICAAIVVLFSITAPDGANARGTFRLEGAWPSSSARNQANEQKHLHRSGSAQLAHAPRLRRNH